MRNPELLLVAILTFALGFAQAADPATAWRPLPFITNGELDTNWIHIGYGGWTVDNGALRTKPDAKGLGLLVYQKERFGNCQIRLIFKTKETNSNSGLYVRIGDGILDQVNRPGAIYELDANGHPTDASTERMKTSSEREEGPWFSVHRGYEIQIASSGAAPLNGTGSVYSLAPSAAPNVETRQWVTMIVTLKGDRIFVDLDGRRITTFDSTASNPPAREIWYQPKRDPKRPQAGYIGLQTHDPKDIVWFKEISVRPLSRDAVK